MKKVSGVGIKKSENNFLRFKNEKSHKKFINNGIL